jgi:hypothetical protein
MIDFNSWLAAQGNFRCVLVELDYRDAGVIKTAYFSNSAFVSTATDSPAHTGYDPFVIGSVQFERSLNEVFTGRSVSKTHDIELILQSDTLQLLTKAVYGQSVRIYLGDKSWPKANFQQIIAGICDGITPEQTKIRIKFRDAADVLQTPLLNARYTDGAAVDQLKPLCLGRCFNVKPVLINAATHTYQFNSTPSASVTAVRFNGSIVPTTNYTVDYDNSTITFSIYPAGDVTMDVDGTVVGGLWLQNAADFIGYIASLRGYSVDCSGLAGYLLGLYITSDTSAEKVLDDICSSIGAYWMFDRTGQFLVRAFNGVPALADINITGDQTVFGTTKIRRVINPLYSLTLGYKRNWTPLSTIAAVVHETSPDVAKELAETAKTKSVTQDHVLANYPQAESINVSTLIVLQTDASAEANRRLLVAATPHFVYEIKQFAAPFQWLPGMCAKLEKPGINGDRAVITKLIDSATDGTCNVEYWQ